jgi:peptidoglycan hydrolase-like protein with peptidoglycan-binding domain
MEYCGYCGEPAEGRFCRMCGAPVGAAEGAAQPFAAVPGQGRGYGAAQGAATAAGPGYGPEPTQMLGTTATPAEFDAYFRSEDGSPGAHGQTQLLPPVLDDYRMRPPQGEAHTPPGGSGGRPSHAEEEDSGPNRPVILVTLGAVVAVAVIILALLYLGNRSTGSNTASGPSPSVAASGTAGATQGGGLLQIPTDGASLTPTTAAPSTAAAPPAQFHGDTLPLGPGSSGTWVKWTQEKLKQLGYYHGSASGDFDQATASAVQRFQAAAGVGGDAAGTVGTSTLVALDAAGSTPNLHLGNHSSDVSRLNSTLSLATGQHVSGSRYSMSTVAAVTAYQRAVGLTPTGQVNAATWAKLQDGTVAAG